MFSSLFYIARKTWPLWVGGSLYYAYTLCTKGDKAADAVADTAEDTVQDLTALAIKLIFDNGEALILSQTSDEIDPIISSVLDQVEAKMQKYTDGTIDSTFELITKAIKDSVEDLKNSKSMQDLQTIADKLQNAVTNSDLTTIAPEYSDPVIFTDYEEDDVAIAGEASDYQNTDDDAL